MSWPSKSWKISFHWLWLTGEGPAAHQVCNARGQVPCPAQVNAAQGPLHFCQYDHDAVIDLVLSGAIFVVCRHWLNLHTLTKNSRVFDNKTPHVDIIAEVFQWLDAEGLDRLSSKFAHDMSDDFGFGQRAEISILRQISHFRFYFSLALLICRLGISRSLSLLFSVTISPPLSLSFSRTETLTRSNLARSAWDDAAYLPWNRVVSGWLWTLFSRDWAEWQVE